MSKSTLIESPHFSDVPKWLPPVQWTLTGIALLLTAGRYVLRLRSNNRLRSDDWSHGFAVIILLVHMAVTTAILPLSIALSRYSSGKGPGLSTADLKKFYRLLIAMTDMFWVVIYSIKFTFLLLYLNIFGLSRGFRKAWWVVLTYIFLSFWASFMTSFWVCGTPSKLLVLDACLSKDAQKVISRYAPSMVALNIAGDIAIITLPLCMLRRLQMKSGQKVALSIVFLMAGLVIFFDIARITVARGGSVLSLAIVWDIMEPLVAVIISSLIPYSALLAPTGRHSQSSESTSRFHLSDNTTNSKPPASVIDSDSINQEFRLAAGQPEMTALPFPREAGDSRFGRPSTMGEV